MTDSWPVSKTDSLASLRDAVTVATKASPDGPIAWRGLSNHEWTLRSTLDRHLRHAAPAEDYTAWLEREKATLKDFQSRARKFATTHEREFLRTLEGPGVWNIMALGRHSGLPTRILDWTMSPWVAVYFACVENNRQDGQVWWFSQSRLETVLDKNWGIWKVPTREEAYRWGGTERAIEESAFAEDGSSWLTKIHHRFMFPRMEAQQGFMTVCRRLVLDHNDAIDSLPEAHTITRGRIRIAASIKEAVLAELLGYNVDARSLRYPGIDLAARAIADQMPTGPSAP